jgi:hypothetical protein
MEHYKDREEYFNCALVVLLYNYLLMPRKTLPAALLLLLVLSTASQLYKCPLQNALQVAQGTFRTI